MGKTIFAAVIAAVLASVVTTLIVASVQTAARVTESEKRALVDETASVERERLERRIADLERRATAAPRASRHAEDASDAAASAPAAPSDASHAVAPDGTPYVSKAQLEAAIAKARETPGAIAVQPYVPVEKKALADIARDMNLSAGEEANLHEILRDSEEEFVHDLLGNKSLDEVMAQVLAAKEDPDKKSEMVQEMVGNGLQNFGKLSTLKDRVKKRVEAVLGKDRAAKFLATPRKSVIAPEFEEVLKDF